ncbi:hypothetical protein D0T50_05255 [Bacteroides sp. 214]|nr:hypothetical protein [Bacteroides sp. 214]
MLLPLLVLGVVACDDSNGSIDYENKIIGKWQLVEEGPDEGNLKAVKNKVILEYFSNGTFKRDVADEDVAKEGYNYTIDSKHLYHYWGNDENPIGIHSYHFFNNKLRTKLIYGQVPMYMGYPYVKIYTRIK